MYKVLVTGNIGSGKSTVCKIFEDIGIPIFYSDKQSAKLTRSNDKVMNGIKNTFGEKLYKGNELDRKALANIVFNDEEKLQKLNDIIHPVIVEEFNSWCDTQNDFNTPYVIEESAIAIELGIQDKFDKIIVVTADEEVRIKRVIARDNCTEEQVRDRMKNQMTDEEKNKYADSVIFNNDNSDAKAQVSLINKEILKHLSVENV